MRWVAFDTETYLIADRMSAPALVCVSFSEAPHLMTRDAGLDRLAGLLADQSVGLVGHSVTYDLGVICAEDPGRFLPLVFDALAADRITDTKIREQLARLAIGQLTYDPLHKRRTSYTLEALTGHYRCGLTLDKSADSWRLRYAELDGVPVDKYPPAAAKYAIDDALATARVYAAQNDHPDEHNQARAAFALHLMTLRGLRTDPEAVAALAESLTAQKATLTAKAGAAGYLRKTGAKNLAAIRAAVTEALGDAAPLTASGKVATDRATLEAAGLGVLGELSRVDKLLGTYLPTLKARSVHPRYHLLKESGRTSASKPNIQQLPRAGGVRECYIPRPGMRLYSIDYTTLELCALAQIQLDLFGSSAMAMAINAGEDLHQSLADLVGCSRQVAKAANFGYPGGMSGATFGEYARGYGVTVEDPDAIRAAWFERWPEMGQYFDHINNLIGYAGEGNIKQHRSERVRGACGYTSACNTLFQGLASCGAKRAVFEVARYCYSRPGDCYPVAFIHDEILIETSDPAAIDAIVLIMVAAMQTVIPDITIKAEASAPMERWEK